MKAGRPVPIRQGASLNKERRGLPRALWLAPGPELAEQPHSAVPAAGHGRPGVAPANGGSAGASITQWVLQAETLGQRCFAAVPGALPAISAPRNMAGTNLGWSPNPAPPQAGRQPRSVFTVLPAASPLRWHWRGACRGAGSPKPECLPLRGVSQLPPAYQGWGRNPRPRAQDGAASAEGEHQVRVTHRPPRATARQSLWEHPEKLSALSQAWRAGSQAISPYSHSPGLGFPVSQLAWLQSTLTPLHGH